jgi:maltooligosyltrehalose trehalohydrolase
MIPNVCLTLKARKVFSNHSGGSDRYRVSLTPTSSKALSQKKLVSFASLFAWSEFGSHKERQKMTQINRNFILSAKNHTVVKQQSPSESQTSDAPADQVSLRTSAPTPDANGNVNVRFQFDANGLQNSNNIRLVGNFDPESGRQSEWNNAGVPLRDDGKGGDLKAGDNIYSATVSLNSENNSNFQWGVRGDVHDRHGLLVLEDKALTLGDSPLTFSLHEPGSDTQTYSPIQLHRMGLHKVGQDGVSFRTWSPKMGEGDLADYKLHVEIFNADGEMVRKHPMRKESDGNWNVELENGWKDLQGLGYQYAARNSKGELLRTEEGMSVAYADPRAEFLQGQQRGVERIFVDPIGGYETGWYDDSGKGGPNYSDNQQWGRFTVDDRPDADNVQLVLKDADGRQLTRDDLLAKIGEPNLVPYDQAAPQDRRDHDVLINSWKIKPEAPVTDQAWTKSVSEDGTIDMQKVGNAWVSTLNNFNNLVGLQYEFRVHQDGKLVGDLDGNGALSAGERRLTPFNDDYDNTINQRPGAQRLSLIRESSFEFLYDDVPREEDTGKWVIYELHVGSFAGSKDNVDASNFKDMISELEYIKELGANTIELMPFNEFGGKRDWGYTPDHYFAGAEAYGFEMNADEAVERGLRTSDEVADGQETVWVHGTDAVKLFVDEAHKRGINVVSDVVYNHTSGKADGDNPMELIDGPKDSFFNWFDNGPSWTPWGKKPDFGEDGVKQHYTDNYVQQFTTFNMDGVRADFPQVIHDTGTPQEKVQGQEGLRMMNRAADLVRPHKKDSWATAEDFSGKWEVAADYDARQQRHGYMGKGMGFSSIWAIHRFHHDLIGAVRGGEGKFNMDRLMEAVVNHPGAINPDHTVIASHTHDEVGNTQSYAHRAAAGSREDDHTMGHYPRAAARTAAAVTLTGAGVPMLWQGEEFLTNNDFKHGLTSTWGMDWSWRDSTLTPDRLDKVQGAVNEGADLNALGEDAEFAKSFAEMTPEQREVAWEHANKRGHFEMYKDLVALRKENPALASTAGIERVWTHNADRTMAFKRSAPSGEEVLVVSNFSPHDRHNYGIGLPEGQWEEIINTDSRHYGGANKGNGGRTVSGQDGLTLAAGATAIFKRVN